MNALNRFSELYQSGKELVLLEWTYLAISVVSFLLAGVFALFNQALGVGVLIIPLVAFIAFSMNIVAWALVKFAVETMIPDIKSKQFTSHSRRNALQTPKSSKPTKTTERSIKHSASKSAKTTKSSKSTKKSTSSTTR